MSASKDKKVDSVGPVKKESFQPGDLVFAKLKGHSHWPSIVNKVDENKSLKAKRYRIVFFGTYQIAHLSVQDICPYEENKERFGKPRSTRYFKESLTEIQTRQLLINIGNIVDEKKVFICFY